MINSRKIIVSVGLALNSMIATAASAQVATQFAGAIGHTCARLGDGKVLCWGDNFYGQLGNGMELDIQELPVEVRDLTNATSVVTGPNHTCAVLGDGGARCWGLNESGQLGNGNTSNQLTPVAPVGLASVTQLAAGEAHTCALRSDRTVRCWGSNSRGQLGTVGTGSTTPVAVAGISTAVSLATGSYHTCVVLQDGTGRCWGYNQEGELGDGTTTNRTFPVTVTGLAGASDITAGDYHTCARLTTGAARCWGINSQGGLGDNSTDNRLTPVTVSGLSNATTLEAGGYHTCAILHDSTGRCWGSNTFGEVGNQQTFADDVLTPVTVTDLAGQQDLALGQYHSCYLLSTGSIRCVGDNGSGQLGNPAVSETRYPQPVRGLQEVGPLYRVPAMNPAALATLFALLALTGAWLARRRSVI
jgi:alpha-tubulin suppressor-like RCC1 family protein